MFDSTISGAINRRQEAVNFLGLAVVLAVFIGSGLVSYHNTQSLNRNSWWVTHTYEVLTALEDILTLAKDAETGQRGFLVTFDDKYLEHYHSALRQIDERISEVDRLTHDNESEQKRIPILRSRIKVLLDRLEVVIQVRRDQGFEAAQTMMRTDRGKLAMDAIRDLVAEMQKLERDLLTVRMAEMENTYRKAIGSSTASCLLGIFLSIVVWYLLRRASLVRQRQEWLQTGQIELSNAIVGDLQIEQLGENVLRYLAEFVHAQVGALFVQEGNHYRRVSTLGVPRAGNVPESFQQNDGLLAQSVRDARTLVIDDIPDGYLTFGTSLGQAKPRHLLIAPVISDKSVNGVLELGFLQPIDSSIKELFSKISEPLSMAIRAVKYRAHLQNLLEETQRQADELQVQGEELRVSNEELEEQSRALKESQNRLEEQQAELEQTNSQLEEQAELLESQRDEVNRAKSNLEDQTRELEQANQYKSNFLANMSHELRTPLNSALILAKLLADNPNGNLTADQVQYAQTIRSAGNDLLSLINDILDLSKIEAGHMEMRPEQVRLSQMIKGIRQTFEPIAEQKNLLFEITIDPGCPAEISTDRQRIEQILKNLISNALKFTEKGSVKMTVNPASDQRVQFAVIDTGIGIAQSEQQIIFDAFRQADGRANRHYGGTGLGLSISRELARLLGGEIHLVSELNRGSTFTFVIPERYDINAVKPRDPDTRIATSTANQQFAAALSANFESDAPSSGKANSTDKSTSRSQIPDDRESLTADARAILVIEDDERFARVLYELAHELNFQCLIASCAEDGLATAIQFLPNAIVLDVGLPDHSGLSVLDRLKHDRRTRHIPVHVVSGSDYSETALSLGAVGYLMKPVKREELATAMRQMETRFSQRMRRVLVVEDDAVQLDSLQKLLSSNEVETIGVRTAADCLDQLKDSTFDCMVLDLTLPDSSGYTLLETLGRDDVYAFPPVIVYTGRDLSTDEEQQLRRYSKSIIIKGAKSPERLLDEVTLFLHQVVSELPPEQQQMLEKAQSRDSTIEGRQILIVEDDIRNVFALTSILEPKGAQLRIARNGFEALEILKKSGSSHEPPIDLVLMDVMMPEMDGITAVREIRKTPEWKKLPIIMLTAKAMKNDQEQCLNAGANDYMAKPLDVEKLLSLIRVWIPR